VNLTKQFQLTEEESRALKGLVPKGGISYLKKDRDIKEDSVLSFSSLDESYEEVIAGALSKIGPRADIIETGVFAFSNVGLHTDSIYPKSHVAAVIPVAGYGSLYVTDGNKVEQNFIGKTQYGFRLTTAILFDDQKPHCYFGNGLMLAIICGVRRELLE
jgi:hypothetical protein